MSGYSIQDHEYVPVSDRDSELVTEPFPDLHPYRENRREPTSLVVG